MFAASKAGSTASSVASVKKALRNAEEFRDALEAMLTASKTVVAVLDKDYNAIAIQNGFERISDDVLAMITEYAHESEQSLVPETLSRVNRRLRNVVLRMPKLWTYISSRRNSPSKITSLVNRSAPRMLSVLLEGRSQTWNRQSEEGEKREAVFLVASFKITAFSSANRLQSLAIVLDIEYEKMRDRLFLKALQDSFQDLTFPVLQSLDVSFKNFRSADETLPDTIHFYRYWKMPSLCIVKARNFIPEFSDQISSQLESCLIELDHDTEFDHGGDWDVDEVMEFIASLGNVEELGLALHCQQFTPIIIDEEFMVKLHKLQRLSLTFGLNGIVSCGVFFAVFDFPNVRSITIDAIMPVGATPGNSICGLLECFGKACMVEDIAIKIRHEHNREDFTFFDSMLEDIARRGFFDHTRNLRIDYPVSGDSNAGFFDLGKKVRSVRIEDCEGEVNDLLGLLAERTNDFEGNAEDGTCLIINPSVVEDWMGPRSKR